MSNRYWVLLVLAGLGLAVCNQAQGISPGKPSVLISATGDAVFEMHKVHQVHLSLAAKDLEAMQPPPPKGPFGGRPPAMGPDAGAGNFGFEFTYVAAEVQLSAQLLKNVGLRYKGSGTYLVSQQQAKRSFKVDFDRYQSGQRWQGVAKINLNSAVMDPTRVREALAYHVFREAGVPAPRTAFAEVSITAAGKYEREYLGLYTMVEQVDEDFLAIHFQNGQGLLLKPEGIRGLPHYGNDQAAYEKNYNFKSKKNRGDWKRLIELTRLVNKADDAEFRKKIAEVLEVEGFVRFLAANTMLASLDGFTGMGHNYYLYLSPVSGKFTFIPWDLDLSFGAFTIYGSPDQLANLSIRHPHLGDNKLIDKMLAMSEVKAAYHRELRKLTKELFTREKLGDELSKLEALAREPLSKERRASQARREGMGFGPGASMFAGLPLRDFIEKRAASVAAQLDDKKQGYVPQMMMPGMPRK